MVHGFTINGQHSENNRENLNLKLTSQYTISTSLLSLVMQGTRGTARYIPLLLTRTSFALISTCALVPPRNNVPRHPRSVDRRRLK